MKKMKSKMLMILTVFSVLLSSCAKDGETGPAGPTGNANVISTTVTIPSSGWTLNGTEWDVNINVPAITQDIVTKGIVQVFLSSDGTQWIALPFSFQGTEFNYSYSIGQVQVAFTWYNGAAPTSAPNNLQFKVVAISASNRIANPNVDWTNYEEVRKVFGLGEPIHLTKTAFKIK